MRTIAFLVTHLLMLAVGQCETPQTPQAGALTHREVEQHEVPEPFQFHDGTVTWKKTATHQFDGYETFRLIFPSPVVTESPENNTVHCEYFIPSDKPGTVPAAVVLHILGGDFELSRMCCRTLASSGVAALFLKMPYYGPRRPKGSRERMISTDPVKTVARMTQAVKDIRRAADWLSARKEVDPDRLCITGISLGGITASLAASVEPRFSKSCFVLAGGDFATLFMESAELAEERKAWEDQNVTAEQVAQALGPVDPLTYATRLRGRDVLMINGRKDKVIPHACTKQLWEAAGKPEIIWWNANHYSAAIFLPSGLARMVRFFQGEGVESQFADKP